MPATSTVTIAAEQREAIYSYVHDRLSALGDVWKSIEREDYATAERMGGEFRQDFHLLDALGWHAEQCNWRALGLSRVEPEVEKALMHLRVKATARQH
jgi:hypothetical protein